MKKLITLICILSTLNCSAQIVYFGAVELDDSTLIMDLELNFKVDKDSLKGYSLMNKNTVQESKSSIEGYINREDNIYTIMEINVITNKPKGDDVSFCLLEMELKEEGDKLQGKFIGHLENGDQCASGQITLLKKTVLKELLKKSASTKSNKIKTLSNTESFTFDTNSKSLQFYIWDAGVQDNDSISILLNDQEVVKMMEITSKMKFFKIRLHKGKNKLVLIAENEGKYKPNTSRILIGTKEGNHQFKYGISKYEKITLLINRD
jgi:hypothetical protein